MKIDICLFCTGTIPSSTHTQKCLHKPGEDWVGVANGERKQVLKNQEHFRKLREQIVFWQGKFAILKEENNKLRNKLRNINND